MEKTSYNVPGGDAAGSPFAACMYMTSSKNTNPYFATPWFAVKLYPRAYPSRTEAQLVTRDEAGIISTRVLYTWYSAPNIEPRGIFLLVLNSTSEVYYYFWSNDRASAPYARGSWTSTGLTQVLGEKVYIYLTINNTVTVSSRKVHVRYIQVYKGSSITVENVASGWTVEVTDNGGTPLYSSIAEGTSVSFNILDYIIDNDMPLEGHVVVRTCNVTEFNTYGGWRISPGETKAITVSISGVPSGEYRVKVVTKNGVEYQYKVMIP